MLHLVITAVVALLAAVAGAVAVMAFPVSLVFHWEWGDAPRTRWRVRWLAGLVDIELQGSGERRRERARTVDTRHRRQRRRSTGRGRGVAVARALARTEGFAQRTLGLIAELGKLVRYDDVYAHTVFGLDDPADTGRLYGVVAPVCLAATAAGVDVSCQARFTQPTFAGSCGGRLEVRPIMLVGAMLRFLCAPPTLRALRAAWVSR